MEHSRHLNDQFYSLCYIYICNKYHRILKLVPFGNVLFIFMFQQV